MITATIQDNVLTHKGLTKSPIFNLSPVNITSGNTAKLNGLTQMRTIFKSQAVLVSKDKFSAVEPELKEEFLIRIQAAISAQKLKYLMMNIPQTEKSIFVIICITFHCMV